LLAQFRRQRRLIYPSGAHFGDERDGTQAVAEVDKGIVARPYARLGGELGFQLARMNVSPADHEHII
jgi:hypothetical protein